MNNKQTKQAKDWREARRLQAWELKQKGWKQRDIAEALGVTPGAVSQWVKRAKEGGEAALRRRPAPGPTPRLSQEQVARLPYTPTHVGRIVRQLGWSLQKPVERASQRDEETIERWRNEEWEQVKKKPPRRTEPSCS